MARLARIVVPDIPHHLTQRGNRREDIFFDDADRRKYLRLLKDQCELYRLEVWAYCLMTNHVHLVVVPRTPDALGQAMRRMNSQYAAYVNRRQGLSGHLWQGRFFSCPLDERHFWSAVRYVERNPVRDGLAAKAWNSHGPAHRPTAADDTTTSSPATWRKPTTSATGETSCWTKTTTPCDNYDSEPKPAARWAIRSF